MDYIKQFNVGTRVKIGAYKWATGTIQTCEDKEGGSRRGTIKLDKPVVDRRPGANHAPTTEVSGDFWVLGLQLI